MTAKKRVLGQFFTTGDLWLKEHILEFIQSTNASVALDPFAGGGDLLRLARQIGFQQCVGYDIDATRHWKVNDSLRDIPKIADSIIITNPPYLTNYSAKRRGVYADVHRYFEHTPFDDLYQLAIEKCLEHEYGVMIVPETFINSSFPKGRLHSITIIEEHLFDDTDTPVCVICFDGKEKPLDCIGIYKNEQFVGSLGFFEKMRRRPNRAVALTFNAPHGQIALRAIDATTPEKRIAFMKPDELAYDMRGIKESSRLITRIAIEEANENLDAIIEHSNDLLDEFRRTTKDVLLSPFKGNTLSGQRRRRLDYLTARAILEEAVVLAGGGRTQTLNL